MKENQSIKVSIIVAIYNSAKFLDKLITSIIDQTYKNIEVILVDDGSPDNSGEICDKYAALDSRIKVLHKKMVELVMHAIKVWKWLLVNIYLS